MKSVHLLYSSFVVTIIVSCTNSNDSDSLLNEAETTITLSKSLDPVTLHFFKHDIFHEKMTGKNAIYFLYPGFCGACNDTVIKFIKTNDLSNFNRSYIFSENDSGLIAQFTDLGGLTLVFEPDYLMEFGLYKATNHLYLFQDSLLLYDNSINAENIEDVRRETDRF